MMQIGSKLGMITMKDAAYALLNDGVITQETARTLLATSSSESDNDADSGNKPKNASSGGKFGHSF
jgi:Tfp pilus assembly pilus retraction ATPase PilT